MEGFGADSVVQNHVEQRPVNPNATVIFDKAEIAKSVHKETHTRSGGSDHFRQRFLRDLRNQRFRFTRLAKFRH